MKLFVAIDEILLLEKNRKPNLVHCFKVSKSDQGLNFDSISAD